MYKRLLYKQKKCLQCGLLFSKSFSLHIQTLRKPNYGHFQLFQLLFVCNNLKIRKKIKSLEWNCYQVVAVVEARVVGARKGDHELAGVLVHAVHRNAMSLKKNRKNWLNTFDWAVTTVDKSFSYLEFKYQREEKDVENQKKSYYINFNCFWWILLEKFSELSRKQPFLFM